MLPAHPDRGTWLKSPFGTETLLFFNYPRKDCTHTYPPPLCTLSLHYTQLYFSHCCGDGVYSLLMTGKRRRLPSQDPLTELGFYWASSAPLAGANTGCNGALRSATNTVLCIKAALNVANGLNWEWCGAYLLMPFLIFFINGASTGDEANMSLKLLYARGLPPDAYHHTSTTNTTNRVHCTDTENHPVSAGWLHDRSTMAH